MEGSDHRIRNLIKTALPAALLVGAVGVAGCGGGGGSGTAKAPAPVNQSSSKSGGLVSAGATVGLVGPSARATDKQQQFDDKSGKISPKAKGKTGAEKHGVIAPGQCPGDGAMPDDGDIAQLNDAILCLVNGERADNGLPALNHSTQLDQSSQGMCQLMVTEHFFSHETPDGKTVVDRIEPTGYIPKSGDWVVGENLAWGNGGLSTPQAIVNGWMNSAGHKANILAPDYKDIGLAACMGAPLTTVTGGTVYVNNFGAKAGADANIELPGHESTTSTNGTNAAAAGATVAGTKSAASRKRAKAKRRAACIRRAKKVKSAKRRHAAVTRCRRR
ncbi:MAG TPA: CAP domain-containing protein [Thermoleophilaceae bacterium]|nr:CAP domain-containing protein [Thermoleophilaceae bacterium]